MRQKFRTQLTLTITVILLAAIVLISLLSNVFINNEFEKYIKDSQITYSANMVDNLNHQYNSYTGGWDEEYIHGVGMSAMYDGYIIKLIDSEENPVWDAQNHDMATCSHIMTDIIERMSSKRPDLKGGFVSQEFELNQNNEMLGTLVVSYYGPYFLSESDFHFIDSLNLVTLIIGGIALLCSIFAGVVLAGRISRPIMKIADITSQIAEGDYKTRYDGRGSALEVDELITSVNHMAETLDRQEELRKRLTIDMAHELRTPLTVAASHLEAMAEGVWEPTPERLMGCYDEIERITGLVKDLERLAVVEGDNFTLVKSNVDLLELVQAVVANFQTESIKNRISVMVEGDETHVNADRDRLLQVIVNLISNAVKYSVEDGWVRVLVKDEPEKGIIIVEDNGIGIPKEELPFIFERFYRTDLSRNRKTGGVGIGLTIVKSIVTAHGGTVKAESWTVEGSGDVPGREDVSGSRFIVTIPKK